MDEPQNSNAARHLQVIYTDIAQRVRAIMAVRPIWPCTRAVMAAAISSSGLRK
jgi:hypothetical protein